jgi:hypothetical protein
LALASEMALATAEGLNALLDDGEEEVEAGFWQP